MLKLPRKIKKILFLDIPSPSYPGPNNSSLHIETIAICPIPRFTDGYSTMDGKVKRHLRDRAKDIDEASPVLVQACCWQKIV